MATVEEIGSDAELDMPEVGAALPPMIGKVFDPYLYRVAMPHIATFYPLGFPVQVMTNSPAVLEAAKDSWSQFEQRFTSEPIRLRVGLKEDGSTECPGLLTSRAYGAVMVGIANAENFFISDVMRNLSFAWISPGAVGNPYYLRHHILESAALSHIANRYSAPVHAACVSRDGRGVMLCGDSGAGKSTLAFACARAGWTYTSDDASFLVHGRSDRQVVGNCHSVRLRPETGKLFDEVKGRALTPRMQGKPSVEIGTRELGWTNVAVETQVDFVVFLNRQQGERQELRPYSRKAARDYLQQHLNWDDALRPEQIASTERMLSARMYEMRYHDLDWAIACLDRLVQEGR